MKELQYIEPFKLCVHAQFPVQLGQQTSIMFPSVINCHFTVNVLTQAGSWFQRKLAVSLCQHW